jgi:hypothetical protein
VPYTQARRVTVVYVCVRRSAGIIIWWWRSDTVTTKNTWAQYK